jgi:hypothetical protein
MDKLEIGNGKQLGKELFMKSRIGLVLSMAILSLFFSVGSPSADEKAEKAALAASTKWLALVDDGDYSKSWERAARIFRAMEAKVEWQTKLNTYRTPLGKVSERNVKSKQYTKTLPDAPEGEYFVILYETVFKNKQTITEEVTCVLEKDGKWKVAGYHFTPPGQESQPPPEKKKE